MWKGVVVFGDVRVPVKLYAAATSRRPPFRLLHAEDREPVRQVFYDADTGEVVPREDTWRAAEVEGRRVLLSDEDLSRLDPEPSREIEVLRFVPHTALDDRWYDRPYWLGPDGEETGLRALVKALAARERVGIARWTMRKRRYQGALRLRGEHLMLLTLRHPEDVVPLSRVPAPEGRAPTDAERKMARQLVEALEGRFDPSDFPETFTDRVRELVQAKVEGAEAPRPPEGKARREDDEDLTGALEASLEAARDG